MKRPHSPYAVARLDGILLYREMLAGFTQDGRLPIVHFKISTGEQSHPVWALEDVAEEVFAFCQAAKQSGVGEHHLQVSMLGSWVSAEKFSNIVASHIEWHIASSVLRTEAIRLHAAFKNGRKSPWPNKILLLPVAEMGLPFVGTRE